MLLYYAFSFTVCSPPHFISSRLSSCLSLSHFLKDYASFFGRMFYNKSNTFALIPVGSPVPKKAEGKLWKVGMHSCSSRDYVFGRGFAGTKEMSIISSTLWLWPPGRLQLVLPECKTGCFFPPFLKIWFIKLFIFFNLVDKNLIYCDLNIGTMMLNSLPYFTICLRF